MGDPQETWLARAPGGRVAGWYQLELPDLENRDRDELPHMIAVNDTLGYAVATPTHTRWLLPLP
jgi:hypothetical protein